MRCKKLSAILLAAAICVNVISVQAFAYSDETETAVPTEEQVTETEVPEKEEKEEAAQQMIGAVTTNGSRLNVRTGSSTDFGIISQLVNGDTVTVLGEENGWYKIQIPEKIGYVCGEYLEVAKAAIAEKPDMTLEEMEKLLKQYQQAQESSKGVALTPDGNLTLVDDIGSDTGARKQFITLVTKAGNTFYLIIDRDDEGDQTVHFLNLVDEADLLALMDEEEAAKYEKPAEKQEVETPPVTEPENPEPAEQEPEEPEKKAPNMIPAILLLTALAGVGGFVGYKKLMENQKKKEQEKPDPDADYVDEDEDYGYDENAEYEDDEEPDYSDEDDNEPV